MSAGSFGFSLNSLQLLSEDYEQLALIAERLKHWGCCNRCILRFLGEKEQFVYKYALTDLAAVVEELIALRESSASDSDNSTRSAVKKVSQVPDTGVLENVGEGSLRNESRIPADHEDNASICVTCLGLLQNHYCGSEFISKIVKMITDSDVEFPNFFCSVTLPVNCFLRDHAIWVLLRKLAPKMYYGLSVDDMQPVKDIWKWVNGPNLAEELHSSFDQKSTFEIKLYFTHEDQEKECNFLLDCKPATFKRRKTTKGMELFTRTSVVKAVENLSHDKFMASYQCPPVQAKQPIKCDIACQHEAIFIAGRYNKYSRILSQTPWFIDGDRKTESSIEEQICDLLKAKTRAAEYRFSSAGREDVDTRMLGSGRPFVVEIVQPLKVNFTQSDYSQFQKEINAATNDVEVKDLQHVTKEDVQVLKKGEEEKTKSYSALCSSTSSFTQEQLDTVLLPIKNLEVKQKTPIRVLHRRPLAVRPKTIHNITAKKLEGSYFRLYLSTEAGTYIKEFVHGDFGRTRPNLGNLLGADCDILELDVEAVELDWPPSVLPVS